MSARTCELCGATSDDVRVQLAWYKHDIAHRCGMPQVQTAARCDDVAECRRRCLANGDPWPLVASYDEVVRPRPEPAPTPVAVAVAIAPQRPEPEPEEATAWFE